MKFATINWKVFQNSFSEEHHIQVTFFFLKKEIDHYAMLMSLILFKMTVGSFLYGYTWYGVGADYITQKSRSHLKQ